MMCGVVGWVGHDGTEYALGSFPLFLFLACIYFLKGQAYEAYSVVSTLWDNRRNHRIVPVSSVSKRGRKLCVKGTDKPWEKQNGIIIWRLCPKAFLVLWLTADHTPLQCLVRVIVVWW